MCSDRESVGDLSLKCRVACDPNRNPWTQQRATRYNPSYRCFSVPVEQVAVPAGGKARLPCDTQSWSDPGRSGAATTGFYMVMWFKEQAAAADPDDDSDNNGRQAVIVPGEPVFTWVPRIRFTLFMPYESEPMGFPPCERARIPWGERHIEEVTRCHDLTSSNIENHNGRTVIVRLTPPSSYVLPRRPSNRKYNSNFSSENDVTTILLLNLHDPPFTVNSVPIHLNTVTGPQLFNTMTIPYTIWR